MLKIKKLLIAALILATSASAQPSSTISEVAKTDRKHEETSFDIAVKELEKDIIVAMDAFARAGVPDNSRIADFDLQLQKIDGALAVTADGGELDLKITAALAAQNNRLRKYEALSIDQKLASDQREQYEEFIKKGKKTANSIMSNKTSLRRLRRNLEESRVSVDANKQFYIDAVAEKELELASKAFTTLNQSMLLLTQVINEMKSTRDNLNKLPQQ